MMKFFRKIRQSLLAENRFSEYVIYAIGEIILIVIGILIALAISNWNNKRIAEIRTTKLLNKLIIDLNSDIERISELENTGAIGKPSEIVTNSLLQLVNAGIKREDLEFMTSREHPIFVYYNYNLHSTTFEELKNTGSLYSVEKGKLAKAIQEYYKICEKDEFYNITWGDRVMELKSKCSSGWIDFEYLFKINPKKAIVSHPWIFDMKSENYIHLRRYLVEAKKESGYTQWRLDKIKNRSKELISLIEKEIK